jgi:CRISPR/Cas system-associated endonuclease Cas1
MHQKKQFRGISPAFALDHMEPLRPVVDRAVLQLINSVTFTRADFLIQNDGVCRLNPQLARKLASLAMEHCEILGFPKRSGRYQRARNRRAIDSGS